MKNQAKTSLGRGVPRSGEARARGPAHNLPALKHLILDGARAYPDDEQTVAAAKELRALLRVVGAALGLRFSPGVVTGDVDALARALSRLARAGKSRGDER